MLVNLWYRDKATLAPDAARLEKAVEEYLRSERNGLNVPEPDVEDAVRAIPAEAPFELRMLAGTDPDDGVRAAPITCRHMAAWNCERFDRKRTESRPLSPEEAQERGLDPSGDSWADFTVAEEHPVTSWIRTLSDSVVIALIRENPYWLRNAAIADRIFRWRRDLLDGSNLAAHQVAKACLDQLAGHSVRRGRPSVGPQFSAEALREAFETVEARMRQDREAWLAVREEHSDKASLLTIGAAFLRRCPGWDSPEAEQWQSQAGYRVLGNLTPDQTVQHLARHLLIVHDTNDDKGRWVVIDDDGWPRAAAVALLAARWKTSKGWVLKTTRGGNVRSNPN